MDNKERMQHILNKAIEKTKVFNEWLYTEIAKEFKEAAKDSTVYTIAFGMGSIVLLDKDNEEVKNVVRSINCIDRQSGYSNTLRTMYYADTPLAGFMLGLYKMDKYYYMSKDFIKVCKDGTYTPY